MTLLIFLDLTYNPCKNFKFYSLQGQNFKIFLIFTNNQGKVFLILPIPGGGGGHMYTWSLLGVPPGHTFIIKVTNLAVCEFGRSIRPLNKT